MVGISDKKEKNGYAEKVQVEKDGNNRSTLNASTNGRKRKATDDPDNDDESQGRTMADGTAGGSGGSGGGILWGVSKRFKSSFSKLLFHKWQMGSSSSSNDDTTSTTCTSPTNGTATATATAITSPSQILSSKQCTVQTLTVSDQHATLLLSSNSTNSDQKKIEIKSILKLTLVPFHRETLGSNPVVEPQETLQPELKLLENDPQASRNIISFLQSYDFHLKSESGAEYSYYNATPSKRESKHCSSSSSSSSSLASKAGSFNVELISPASERQITRSMPSHSSCLIEETPQMYNDVVKPYIQSIVEGGKSLNWIYNIIDGKKEQERLLVNTDTFIINIDTKWRSHPDAFKTPREEWYQHKCVEDLYCLGIIKQRNITTVRDLNQNHVPILKSMKDEGLSMIEKVYGVSRDQIRVFVHYHPQFYHFHVHFTRLQNEIGAVVERGHLVSDIIQNLELDGDFYQKRTISYKLKVSSPLYLMLQNSSGHNATGNAKVLSTTKTTTTATTVTTAST